MTWTVTNATAQYISDSVVWLMYGKFVTIGRVHPEAGVAVVSEAAQLVHQR